MGRWPLCYGLLLVAALCLSAAAAAQPASSRVLSDEAKVSLLTIYPGPALHARFGHTAIRVADPEQDLDIIYNYGTFDFDSPTFIAEFIRGHLDYYLSVAPMDAALHHYQHVERRAVVEQVLDLTADERERVFAYLRENARPENRTYRYHFLYDNCSTRVRDVFEAVLGDGLRFEDAEPPGMTYRQMVGGHMKDSPWLWLGMDLAMGRPADEAVGVREAMFLPLSLMRMFDMATVTADGETRQLVRESHSLYWYEGAEERGAGFAWPAVLMWTMLAAVVVLTWHEMRQPVMTAVQRRRGAVVMDALLLGVVGLAGVVLAGLWFGTAHDVAGPNWNLAWAWPTHAIAAVMLLRRPTGGPVLRGYLWLAAAGAVLAALSLVWWPQSVPLAVLPVVLTLAVRCGWLGWSTSGSAGGGEQVKQVTKPAAAPAVQQPAGGR